MNDGDNPQIGKKTVGNFVNLLFFAYIEAMKQIALITMALAIVGCTHVREEYEAELSTWVGRGERDLLLHFGPPAQMFDVDAKTRIAQYKTERDAVIPGAPYAHFYTDKSGDRRAIWLDTPDRVITKRCDLQFILEGRKSRGKVKDWKYKGNDCFRLR